MFGTWSRAAFKNIFVHSAKTIFRAYFRVFHRAKVRGLEHYLAASKPSIIVPNHVSFYDGCLIAAFVPDRPVFAVDVGISRKWWARPLLALVDTFPVSPSSPYAVKAMVKAVSAGRTLVIFPEGRITVTGALMKIYEAAAVIADKAGVNLVPVRLDGPQFSYLSRLGGVMPRRLFPRMTLTFLPPTKIEIEQGLVGKARRLALKGALDGIMTGAAFAAADLDRSLFRAIVDASDRYGAGAKPLNDPEFAPISYRRLLMAAAVIGRRAAHVTQAGECVGLMLPNAKGAVSAFFGLQAYGRVPAMLNFSVGAEGMLLACKAAGVRVVLSSREFVTKAKLESDIERMSRSVDFIWLDEVKASVGRVEKLKAFIDAAFPRRLPGYALPATSPAVVLYTSGSEGTPKGVVHSHRSLLANCAQLEAVLDFNPSDYVVNAMPLFHAFGLTGGTLLPLFNGVPNFLYPSPLHFKILPEVIYSQNATVVFGTDTFLNGWARFADGYDYRSVRYAFAGAEKVQNRTNDLYSSFFGVRLLEGYGLTETAPVLAVNTAKHYRRGTLGRFLPGISTRLEPVDGVAIGGRLFVRGPNLMLGYLRVENPGVIEPLVDGEFDTGDLVEIDADGFGIHHTRLKRMANIAGEKVSMPAVEQMVIDHWPSAGHAVVNLPDPRKGERLVLLTTQVGASAAELLAYARSRGIKEIQVPRDIVLVDRLPLLPTGKVDYQSATRIAGTKTAPVAEEVDEVA